jgi:hypothetical protein
MGGDFQNSYSYNDDSDMDYDSYDDSSSSIKIQNLKVETTLVQFNPEGSDFQNLKEKTDFIKNVRNGRSIEVGKIAFRLRNDAKYASEYENKTIRTSLSIDLFKYNVSASGAYSRDVRLFMKASVGFGLKFLLNQKRDNGFYTTMDLEVGAVFWRTLALSLKYSHSAGENHDTTAEGVTYLSDKGSIGSVVSMGGSIALKLSSDSILSVDILYNKNYKDHLLYDSTTMLPRGFLVRIGLSKKL